MRNFIFVLVFISTSLGFFSCSSNDEAENQSISKVFPKRNMPNKTLEELSNLNDSLMLANGPLVDKIITRSGWGTGVKDADVVGALCGHYVGLHYAWMTGPHAATTYIGCVLVSAAVSSALAAAKEELNPMSNSEMEDFYVISDANYQYCDQLPDSSFLETDPLLLQINLPNRFRYLSYLGRNHNAIISDWRTSRITITRSPNLNTPVDPIDPEEPGIPVNDLSSLYLDSCFNESYCNTINEICNIQNFYNDDYVNYIDLNYNGNIGDTYQLFLEAYHLTSTTSSLISLVNQYITIIESNNDFSDEERKAIYSGFMIAVYSCDYWNNNGL